jgi:glycosyltransferase involved in cell wall biosynthesis
MGNNKKKILYIVEAMGGGVFTYIVDLANQLCKKYDIYIAYAVRAETPKTYKDYFDKRVNLIKVENFTRSINPVKDVKALIEIKKIAKKVKPDLIHLHSSKAGFLGRWAFNGKEIPLYYTPHGYSFLMKDSGWGKRTLYKGLEKLSALRKCTIISCSQGEHEESLRFTDDALLVNNGVNMIDLQKLIKKNERHINTRPYTVFTLGRICYQKNPEQFNEIAQNLPNVKFLWIGDGELRGKLTSRNIEITGWVTRDEALQKLLSADVFLLPSLWEGLPISLLEAMYMKKVCIVSNIIGNKDVISNGVNGFVCNDVNEFIEAIKNVLENNHENLVDKAYKDILDTYNTEEMARKYMGIYRGI